MGKPVERMYKCGGCRREFITSQEDPRCGCGNINVFVVGIPLAEYKEIVRILGLEDE